MGLAPLMGFFRGRWAVVMVSLVVVGALVVIARVSGYHRGYADAKAAEHAKHTHELRRRLTEMERIKDIDLAAAIRVATTEAKVRSYVEAIPIPTIRNTPCPPPGRASDAGEHIAFGESDRANWLRFYNDTVRAAANTDSNSSDESSD